MNRITLDEFSDLLQEADAIEFDHGLYHTYKNGLNLEGEMVSIALESGDLDFPIDLNGTIEFEDAPDGVRGYKLMHSPRLITIVYLLKYFK